MFCRSAQVGSRENFSRRKNKKISMALQYVVAPSTSVNPHPITFPNFSGGQAFVVITMVPYEISGSVGTEGTYRIYIQGEAVSGCKFPSESKPLGCFDLRLWQLPGSEMDGLMATWSLSRNL